MNFAEVLKQAKDSPIVDFHDSKISRKKYQLFFENSKDFTFYLRFFYDHYKIPPESIEKIPCEGKKGVYETREKILNSLEKINNQKIHLFFIDKEWSDLIQASSNNKETFPDVYVTDWHSIENYIVTTDVLKRVLEEIYIGGDSRIKWQAIQRFEESLQKFHEISKNIFSLLLIYIDQNYQPNIDNIPQRFDELLEFSDDLSLQIKMDWKQFTIESCGINNEIIESESWNIELFNENLSSLNPKEYIQGDFELEFFLQFLRRFQKLLGMGEIFQSSKDLLIQGATKTAIPESLKTFLDIHLHNKNIVDEVIIAIFNYGKSLEKKPNTYKDRGEEALRDLFITHVENNFNLNFGAESLNKKGKTDILVGYKNTTYLVIECKFWSGEKNLHETINQLLGYITWRNKNGAIMFFVTNQKLSTAINTIKEKTSQHGNYVKTLNERDDSWFDFTFHIDGDDGIEFTLSILLFHFS